MVWYGMSLIWYLLTLYSMVWLVIVLYGVVCYGTVWYDLSLYNMIWPATVWCGMSFGGPGVHGVQTCLLGGSFVLLVADGGDAVCAVRDPGVEVSDVLV